MADPCRIYQTGAEVVNLLAVFQKKLENTFKKGPGREGASPIRYLFFVFLFFFL